MKKALAFGFLLLYVAQLSAQALPFDTYTSKDGLIADRITAISQDHRGFMWFGSYFGICRYNGISFEKIDLPSTQQNKYVSFLHAEGESMYAGFLFNGGLAEYSNGKAKAYYLKGKDSAAGNEFLCATGSGDGGLLLCNSSRQLFAFRKGRFSFLCNLDPVSTGYPKSMIRDRYGNLLIATDLGLCLLSYPYTKARLLYPGQTLFSLAQDPDQTIWLCKLDQRKKITVLRTAGWKNGQFENLDSIKAPANFSLAPYSGRAASGIWGVATDSSLLHFSGNGSHAFKVPLDFNTDIAAVFADREQNIWIANEPGIRKISSFSSQAFHFQEMGAAGGDLLLQSNGLLWATNSKHIYHVANGRIEKKKIEGKKPEYFGVFHLDSQGYLWIGLWNQGIWKTRWKDGRLVYFKEFRDHGATKIAVSTLAEDSSGTLWLGGINGLFCIRNNRIIHHFRPRHPNGTPAFINVMALDAKNKVLWLGDNAQGLLRLEYQISDTGYSIVQSGHIGKAQGLKDTYVRSLRLDHRQHLWVGTRYGGIFEISARSNQFVVNDHNSRAGLACTRIMDIEAQDSTALWFATCNGIQQFHFKTGRWKNYNTSHGLLNAEVYALTMDSRNGDLWALTTQGITRLDLENKELPVPPLVTILTVSIAGKPDSTVAFATNHHRYSYRQGSIGFSFAGASFRDEKKIRYQYKLEGYDHDWSVPVSTNSVNYASLPAGNYVFLVRAVNAIGAWSSEPARFEFRVIRPFYKSPWFYFACITAALFLIYFIRMQRLKQHYKIEKLRLSIAKDLHDDIGSTLGSINLMSQTASRRVRSHAGEDVLPLFDKISQSAENTLEAMDDIVWSINPEKDKAYDLLIRMREFAIPLLEAKNISVDFQVAAAEEARIPMNLRRNLFLIFKEAIYNVMKHAAATHVCIELKMESGHVLLLITDNGRGFSTHNGNRNGLKNLDSRARSIGGTLKIVSRPGETSVQLRAPLR